MDAVWFQQALERVGASQADLARALQLAPSAVSRMLRGERQMKPVEQAKIVAFLGVTPEEVLNHLTESPTPATTLAEAPRRGRGRPAAAGSGPLQIGDRIPIRSGGRGGNDQAMFLQDEVGYTPRPANLGGVRAAYAIYMVGDSMQPRYEQGWLLHVNPFKPPTRGRDAVVYKQGQIVLIKQFVGWEGDALVLRQFNPPDTLRIPRAEVRECHLVVGADQEG